jgi:hypothetical protein
LDQALTNNYSKLAQDDLVDLNFPLKISLIQGSAIKSQQSIILL